MYEISRLLKSQKTSQNFFKIQRLLQIPRLERFSKFSDLARCLKILQDFRGFRRFVRFSKNCSKIFFGICDIFGDLKDFRSFLRIFTILLTFSRFLRFLNIFRIVFKLLRDFFVSDLPLVPCKEPVIRNCRTFKI